MSVFYELASGMPVTYTGKRGLSAAILRLEVGKAVKLPTHGQSANSLIVSLRRSGRTTGRVYTVMSLDRGSCWVQRVS